MSDVKKFLRDLGYFGVGAAAVIVETGSKVVNSLVRKGKKTLQDNQDTVDDIVRKAKEAGERIKDAVEKAAAPSEKDEPIMDDPAVDEPACEGPVAPDAIYRTDEPVPPAEPSVEEPVAEEPIVVEPVAEEPIVVEPVAEEPVIPEASEAEKKPEETING